MTELLETGETTTDFDPTQTGAVYDLFAPSWRMCRDFAEMHQHILRDGTYLDRFGEGTGTVEPASQFNWRKQASSAELTISIPIG